MILMSVPHLLEKKKMIYVKMNWKIKADETNTNHIVKGNSMDANDRYDSLLKYYGEHYNVDAELLKAQIKAESNFNPGAVSPAGARGLAQFMPETFLEWYKKVWNPKLNDFGFEVESSNPEISICLQAAYMSMLLIRYGGNVSHALAAYNWGMGNVDKIKDQVNFQILLPEETRNYIERILS
jgi:soluble lytic murein transglycosylase-like protein